MRSWSWETDVCAGRGSARVDGRLRPGNEVKRTLIIEGAIVALEVSG